MLCQLSLVAWDRVPRVSRAMHFVSVSIFPRTARFTRVPCFNSIEGEISAALSLHNPMRQFLWQSDIFCSSQYDFSLNALDSFAAAQCPHC